MEGEDGGEVIAELGEEDPHHEDPSVEVAQRKLAATQLGVTSLRTK